PIGPPRTKSALSFQPITQIPCVAQKFFDFNKVIGTGFQHLALRRGWPHPYNRMYPFNSLFKLGIPDGFYATEILGCREFDNIPIITLFFEIPWQLFQVSNAGNAHSL